jgi:hypothetical protein
MAGNIRLTMNPCGKIIEESDDVRLCDLET